MTLAGKSFPGSGGTVVFGDDFTYTLGPLLGQGGWTAQHGAASPDVVSGGVKQHLAAASTAQHAVALDTSQPYQVLFTFRHSVVADDVASLFVGTGDLFDPAFLAVLTWNAGDGAADSCHDARPYMNGNTIGSPHTISLTTGVDHDGVLTFDGVNISLEIDGILIGTAAAATPGTIGSNVVFSMDVNDASDTVLLSSLVLMQPY